MESLFLLHIPYLFLNSVTKTVQAECKKIYFYAEAQPVFANFLQRYEEYNRKTNYCVYLCIGFIYH